MAETTESHVHCHYLPVRTEIRVRESDLSFIGHAGTMTKQSLIPLKYSMN